MNIFVIGTIDNKGGAAMVSWELRKKLKESGHTVNTFVRYKYSNEDDVHVIPRKRYQDWLVKLFAYDLGFAWTDYLMDTKEFKEADIVHCHNIHSNFIDLRTIVKMSKEKPMLWTLHDLWGITGYASDSYTLKHPNKKRFLLYLWDNTPILLWIKKRFYKKADFQIITVSNWLKDKVEKSILREKDIFTIYNGVDTDIFKPIKRNDARKRLKLPLNKKIILVGSFDRHVSKKIIKDYKSKSEFYFLSFGDEKINTNNKNYRNLPYTNDRKEFALYLSSADIYLHPKYAETFGLTCVESLAVGTPVVTNNVDALTEIIDHKKTGYLAEHENINQFKDGIEYILSLPQERYEEMVREGLSKVKNNFTLDNTYEQYLKKYKELIN